MKKAKPVFCYLFVCTFCIGSVWLDQKTILLASCHLDSWLVQFVIGLDALPRLSCIVQCT